VRFRPPRLRACLPPLAVALMSFAACGAEPDALRSKQQAQEKARALAGELVSAVLDIQLRQLEENDLKSLPIYRDIASMKGNIDGLMQGDMELVIRLLAEAQEGPPEERAARLNTARDKIRDVVVQLMAERQRLYRRLEVAKLAAEVQQLLALQSKALETTLSLPQQPADDRERLALAVTEDQADVFKLYHGLVASLQDVTAWGGQASAGAADGLQIIRAAQVEPELRQASDALRRADFGQAANSQRTAVKGLAALLERLNESQGLSDADREAALRLVRDLLARQQDIRERTRQTELTERTTESLLDQQTRLQKDLGKLAAMLGRFPTTEPLIEQAKAASFEATASLFEEKQASAVEQQSRVIGSLAQIEKVLEQGRDRALASKSAAELAAEVALLEKLKAQLEAAESQQTRAQENAAEKPELATKHQSQVAAALTQAEQIGQSSRTIAIRLADAKEKVAAAGVALQQIDAKSAAARQSAADIALTTLHATQAEVESHLADMRRRQKAVEVGELARAAEALERAAAAESEIARQTAEASLAAGLSADKARLLAAEQADITAVAERIAEGVKDLAPSAAEALSQAAPSLDEIRRALNQAIDATAESSKSAAGQAITAAEKAADQLIAAAALLRKRQGESGQQLQSISAEQLSLAETAQQAVENDQESDKTAAEVLARLQKSRQLLIDAQADQAKAEGRPEQAIAMDIERQIVDLIARQNDADQAADELSRGRVTNPLNAATQSQEVADRAGELAAKVSPQLAQPLGQAKKSAAAAAKDTLEGNVPKAAAARQQTRRELEKARELARQMARQTAQSPTGDADRASQSSAAQKAGQAQRLAGQSPASKPLAQAHQQALAAAQQLESGDLPSARASQSHARQSLSDAAKEIDQAIRNFAVEQAKQLLQQAEQAKRLSEQARHVDPGAAVALTQALAAAERGTSAIDQPQKILQAQQEAKKKTEQAAANLAARSQQLRRDRELAQTLAELSVEQQAARNDIARLSRQLSQLNPTGEQASAQLEVAQDLEQAQQQFAAAQLATGEGAADVSGQPQVANQPIREALQIASRLNRQASSDPNDNTGQPSAPRQPGQESSDQEPATQNPPDSANPKSQTPNPKSPPNSSQLGTGLVPSSPQITAKQIAGPTANAAAAKMAAALKGKGKGQAGKSEGESETPQEGASSSTAKKGGAAKGGKTATNQKAAKGDLESAAAADADSRGELANQDTTARGSKLESEAWFAKLPPSLQSAIQAKSRGKAPRGYEERLRRYFESVD
jgi:hypothetical protein